MTLQEFKLRIAKRFETFSDNVTLIIDNKEYPTGVGDSIRLSDVNVDERKLIKVKFDLPPATKIDENPLRQRKSSKKAKKY